MDSKDIRIKYAEVLIDELMVSLNCRLRDLKNKEEKDIDNFILMVGDLKSYDNTTSVSFVTGED